MAAVVSLVVQESRLLRAAPTRCSYHERLSLTIGAGRSRQAWGDPKDIRVYF